MFNVLVMISEGVRGELLSAIGTPISRQDKLPSGANYGLFFCIHQYVKGFPEW